MNCTKDYCEITLPEPNDGAVEAKRKLDTWLRKMEPMDYDAPGSTTRETEV